MILQSDILSKMTDPNWVCKSYAEYLLDAAMQQSDLIAALNDASNDDSLEQMIDARSYRFLQLRDQYKTLVEQALIADRKYSPDKLATNSSDFSTMSRTIEQTTGAHIWRAVQSEFPNTFGSAPRAQYMFNYSPDEVALSTDTVQTKIEQLVDGIMAAKGYNSAAKYAMGAGFIDLRPLLIKAVSNYSIGRMDAQFTLSAVDGTDTSLGNITLDLDSVINEMKSSFASAVAWAQGFSSIGVGSISDALNSFSAGVGAIITDTTSNFANIVNNVKANIAQAQNNILDFFNIAYEQLGWKAVVEDNFTVPDETDVSSYTGASPWSAVSLNTAKDVASAVASTIGTAFVAIGMGAAAVAKKLWGYVKPYVANVTDNPTDVTVQNKEDLTYTALGWFLQTSTDTINHPYTLQYSFHSVNGTPTAEIEGLVDELENVLMNHVVGNWYAIDLLTGTLNFKIDRTEVTGVKLTIGFSAQFKPKCLDIDSVQEASLMQRYTNSQQNVTWLEADATNILNFDKYLAQQDFYLHDGDGQFEEGEALLGFILGSVLTDYVGFHAAVELKSSFDSKYGFSCEKYDNLVHTGSARTYRTDSGPLPSIIWSGHSQPVPQNVTNLDFLKAISGYDSSVSSSSDYNFKRFTVINSDLTANPSPAYNHYLEDIVGSFILCLIYQQYDKQKDSLNYMYLPYCKGTYSFTGGRYHIKTDAENENLLNIMVNAILLITIVVIAVLVCRSILKIRKAKKIAKFNRTKGMLDQDMWNGKKLSTIQALQYSRASKKLSILEGSSSGLSGSTSILSKVASAVNTMRDLSVGETPDNTSTDVSVPEGIKRILNRIG